VCPCGAMVMNDSSHHRHISPDSEVYKYKYEVLDGEYLGQVDVIFATELLRAGHHYQIRVNDNTKNPRVVELVREIERTPT